MNKHKVLYVDDEAINLALFKTILDEKYHILTAEDGMSGLKILSETNNVEVVFSDLRMPVMNGIEFINKAIKITPDAKFYILTGFEITVEIQDALEKGIIKKYLRKPFNMNEISNEIDNVIDKGNP